MMYRSICLVIALYTVTHLQEPHNLLMICLSGQYTSRRMSISVGICLHFHANCPMGNKTSIHYMCDNRMVSVHSEEWLNRFLCQHWESTVKSMRCTTHSDFKCLFFFPSLSKNGHTSLALTFAVASFILHY